VILRVAGGLRGIYFLNGAIASLLVIVFAALAMALGPEIYRCDILQIPNSTKYPNCVSGSVKNPVARPLAYARGSVSDPRICAGCGTIPV
jgi:hypothetical protein